MALVLLNFDICALLRVLTASQPTWERVLLFFILSSIDTHSTGVISNPELFFLRVTGWLDPSEDSSDPDIRVVGVVTLDVFPDPAAPAAGKGVND